MAQTITEGALAAQLAEVLERVRTTGERFIIERDGRPVAALAPAEPLGATAAEIIAKLGNLRMPDPDFADDLEEIQASQPPFEFREWPS